MEQRAAAGCLYVVSTPIGNLQDITFRAVQVLGSVDLVAAEDTRTTHVLLEHYGIKTPLISYYSYNECQRTPQLIEKLLAGRSVALVSEAGTPGISDPAERIVRAAVEHGVPVVPVPGATALISALVVSGLATDRFVFEGFLPLKKGRKKKLQAICQEDRTVIFYESPHRILRTLRELQDLAGQRRVVVARELTKKFEEITRGTVAEVLQRLSERQIKGEFVVVLEGKDGT
jgi:16S rRNA (cytidine1402-2'-O)-methyltransferase